MNVVNSVIMILKNLETKEEKYKIFEQKICKTHLHKKIKDGEISKCSNCEMIFLNDEFDINGNDIYDTSCNFYNEYYDIDNLDIIDDMNQYLIKNNKNSKNKEN